MRAHSVAKRGPAQWACGSTRAQLAGREVSRSHAHPRARATNSAIASSIIFKAITGNSDLIATTNDEVERVGFVCSFFK